MKNIEINPTEGLKLVGYGELVRRYFLDVIPHYVKSFIAEKGRRKAVIEGYQRTEIYTKRYDPGDNLEDHLTFALKFEGINLEILNALFLVVDRKELERFIKETPAGKY
ncbi:MAG: hypothetical protein HQ551_09585, partial [Desulfobacteraceae bacterium]|nr:hypothetical protein [Desulfobacteraceae bacterium]